MACQLAQLSAYAPADQYHALPPEPARPSGHCRPPAGASEQGELAARLGMAGLHLSPETSSGQERAQAVTLDSVWQLIEQQETKQADDGKLNRAATPASVLALRHESVNSSATRSLSHLSSFGECCSKPVCLIASHPA